MSVDARGLTDYFRSVTKQLSCPKDEKKTIVESIKMEVENYLEENPQVSDINDIYEKFGTPQEIGEQYLMTDEPVEIQQKIRLKKSVVLITVISAVLLTVVVAIIVGVSFWNNASYTSGSKAHVIKTQTSDKQYESDGSYFVIETQTCDNIVSFINNEPIYGKPSDGVYSGYKIITYCDKLDEKKFRITVGGEFSMTHDGKAKANSSNLTAKFYDEEYSLKGSTHEPSGASVVSAIYINDPNGKVIYKNITLSCNDNGVY